MVSLLEAPTGLSGLTAGGMRPGGGAASDSGKMISGRFSHHMSSVSSSETQREYRNIKIVFFLRTDSCDERWIYISDDISDPEGGTYMFNTSPKSSDFCLSNDVW